ncbi:MAG: hypothetical protein Q8O24_00380 [Gallionellaceae bacterium]|nr:hypothetical protein [Gallionellaceae bacterium]
MTFRGKTMSNKNDRQPESLEEVLLYQTDDGITRVEVRMAGETVWLNQNQMADLFLTTKQNVGQHIRNVFAEGELASESVVKVSLQLPPMASSTAPNITT